MKNKEFKENQFEKRQIYNSCEDCRYYKYAYFIDDGRLIGTNQRGCSRGGDIAVNKIEGGCFFYARSKDLFLEIKEVDILDMALTIIKKLNSIKEEIECFEDYKKKEFNQKD